MTDSKDRAGILIALTLVVSWVYYFHTPSTKATNSAKAKSQTAQTEPWYEKDNFRCVVSPDGPNRAIQLAEQYNNQYTTKDVDDHGFIAQTTIVVANASSYTFYRGKRRCEMARSASEQEQAKNAEKYR